MNRVSMEELEAFLDMTLEEAQKIRELTEDEHNLLLLDVVGLMDFANAVTNNRQFFSSVKPRLNRLSDIVSGYRIIDVAMAANG